MEYIIKVLEFLMSIVKFAPPPPSSVISQDTPTIHCHR